MRSNACAPQVTMTHTPRSESPSPLSSPLSRDPETLRLLTNFVSETDAGLRRVDEVLMDSTRTPISRNQVEEVVSVFCVVSSVAGLVDAAEMRRLARATEAVLSALQGGMQLARGGLVDVLFEASLVMRELLEEVWAAAIEGRTFVSLSGLDATIERIEYAGRSLRALGGPNSTRSSLGPLPGTLAWALGLEPSP